jgi:hypothetical protein
MFKHSCCALACLCIFTAIGCSLPNYQGRGTAVGALGGAGVGALVGSATGDAGTGALIGAGVGALTGHVVGGALDDVEARNRAEIAASMGRPVAAGAATPAEVVAMSRAGVNPQLITNYINSSGVAEPPSAQDVIYLSQQGVAPEVIQAMQAPRVAQASAVIVPGPPPGPVVIEQAYYGPPPCYGPPCYPHHHRGPRVGWGVSFSN